MSAFYHVSPDFWDAQPMEVIRAAFQEMEILLDNASMRMVEAFHSPKAFISRYQEARQEKKTQVDQWREFIGKYDAKRAQQIEAFEMARKALEKLKNVG